MPATKQKTSGETRLEYADFEEFHGNGEKVYLAIHCLDSKIYKILGNNISEAKSDRIVGDYEVYFPEDKCLLYLHMNKVHTMVGRKVSDETLATFVGILNKLDTDEDAPLEVEFLSPKFKNKYAWHEDYQKMLEKIMDNMRKLL